MPTSVILLRSESTSLDSREPLAALTSRARIAERIEDPAAVAMLAAILRDIPAPPATERKHQR